MDVAILSLTVLLVLTGPAPVQPADVPVPACRTFGEIYSSGKELCEKMWDHSFAYETNLSLAFTMWFFEAENPNNKVADRLGWPTADDCHLEYFHKDTPGPEPDNFTECHPWQDYSCCHQNTVSSAQKIKESYGKERRWDRCGPLSSACERFFVQEACLYECEPNAGITEITLSVCRSIYLSIRLFLHLSTYQATNPLTILLCERPGFYRKFPAHIYNESDPSHNAWQLEGMPIRADYCDAFLRACRHDRFCADDSGSYYSCAMEYAEVDFKKTTGVNGGLVAGVVIACVAVVVVCGKLGYLIFREIKGQPVFAGRPPVFNKLEA
ncbi:uncharacterized protein LOC144912376 isoform X1 [Branchiostoma floridae x Branchiostoma belcheri]